MSKPWIKFTVECTDKGLHRDIWIQEDQIIGLGTNLQWETLIILSNQATIAVKENKRRLATSLEGEWLVFNSGTTSLVGSIYIREDAIIALGQGEPNLVFIKPFGTIGVIGPFDSLLDYLTKEE